MKRQELAGTDGTTAGLLAVLGATFLWATMGPAGKALYAAGAQPITIVGWRAVLASLALCGVLAARAPRLLRLPAGEIPFFAAYGLVVAANYTCYFLALQRVPVAVAITLLYTYPAFTTLAARGLFGESLTPRKILAVILTFVGVTLVAGAAGGPWMHVDTAGALFGLGAGLTMAAYGLLGKRATVGLSPWTTALYSFAFAAAWFAVARPMDLLAALAYSPIAWAGLAYLALSPTLLAYGLFLWAIQRIEVSRASVWTTLEPPVAAILALVLIGETIEMAQTLGIALVVLGVGTLQWSGRR